MTPRELRERLLQQGLMPIDLARLMGVSRQSVHHWLSGRRPVPRYAGAFLDLYAELTRHTADP